MRALQALGWLLRYPEAELRCALPEIEAELRAEPRLAPQTRAALQALARELASRPALELEERYVELFDRTRGLSLHLHEHVHGEARERGAAMVQLDAVYRRAGWELVPGELPDYLPAICEFLSLRPETEAHALLGDAAAVLGRLRTRLEQRGSAYAAVLAALLEIAGPIASLRADPEPAAAELPDLAALDAAGEDAPVRVGADAQPCASARPPRPGAAVRPRIDSDPGPDPRFHARAAEAAGSRRSD